MNKKTAIKVHLSTCLLSHFFTVLMVKKITQLKFTSYYLVVFRAIHINFQVQVLRV